MRATTKQTCLALLLAIPTLLLAVPDPPPPEEHPDARPFMGIEMGAVTDGGVPITRIIPNAAAERFGLEVGDVILSIDESPTGSPALVSGAVTSRRPGDVIEIELLRSGERRTISLELGTRPGDLELRRERADQVLEVLQLRPGLDIADIGCGSGWLSEAIAIELDGNCTVYAVELDEDHIENLKRRALPGVVPILSEPGNISLPKNSLDIAMLHDVASHVDADARASFYKSVKRALRPRARLVVFGPHGEAETMLAVLREHGFTPVDEQALDGLSTDDLDRRLDEGIIFAPSKH
jgi:SAM-dependent methyltransferase